MTKDTYLVILRIMGVFVALALWVVSMTFSISGFNINLPEYAWVGFILGMSVTIIELIWNKQGANTNLTLMLVGILAYIYGVYTNVIGIMAAQGLDGGIMNNMGASLFAFVLAIVLEITPEPLFVWGLTGLVDTGDFLTNMFGGGMTFGFKPHQQQNNDNQYRKEQPKSHTQMSIGELLVAETSPANGGTSKNSQPPFPLPYRKSKCKHCGKPIPENQVYCNSACRQAAYRDRKAQRV